MSGTCKCGISTAVAVVVAVYGLLVWTSALIPSLVYALSTIEGPGQQVQNASCSHKSYNRTYSPCYNVLKEFRECRSLNDINDNITYSLDGSPSDKENEATIMLLSNLLQFNNDCRGAFLALMCLYLLPTCNGTNIPQPSISSHDCTYISTDVCKKEWQEIIAYGLGSVLPSCVGLPANSSCPQIFSEIIPSPAKNSSYSIYCNEDFLVINGTCKPRCGRWATSKGMTIQIILITFEVLGILIQMSFFVFSIIQWKTILVLPKLFIVLMNADIAVIMLMILFNSIYPKALVCSTTDLYDNPNSPAAYCKISGAVLLFALSQLSVTWFVCNSLFYWIFKWPFSARSIQNTACNKYLHTSILSLCLAIPIIPVIITFEFGGFSAVGFPPLLCTPTNPQVAYFSTILPVSVTNAIGSSILTHRLWIVYKHYAAVSKHTQKAQVRPPPIQRRMMAILFLYLIIGAFFLISLAKSSLGAKQLTFSLKQYFVCSDSGNDIDGLCEVFKNAAEDVINMDVVALPYLCIFVLPIINLVHIIRRQDIITCNKCYNFCINAKDCANNQQLQLHIEK